MYGYVLNQLVDFHEIWYGGNISANTVKQAVVSPVLAVSLSHVLHSSLYQHDYLSPSVTLNKLDTGQLMTLYLWEQHCCFGKAIKLFHYFPGNIHVTIVTMKLCYHFAQQCNFHTYRVVK
jgi:hypothetical protein